MKPISQFLLNPPGGQTVEGWLSQFDRQPRLTPRWPASDRMALVAVVAEHFNTSRETETVGYVITDPDQVEQAMDIGCPIDRRFLFFTVPKGRVLSCCEGLVEGSWKKES